MCLDASGVTKPCSSAENRNTFQQLSQKTVKYNGLIFFCIVIAIEGSRKFY